MKKILLLLVNLFFLDQIYAQNLVPNPSFEQYDTCLSSAAIYWGWVVAWDTPSNGSDDVFNICSSTVPSNMAGYQYPHSGNAYAGGQFYGFNGPDYYIEYMQVKLDTPMVEQQTYCASFYVNHANRGFNLALKNFGMCFSDSHTFVPTTNNLNFTPQITEQNFVSDDSAWVLVYGQYTSHGGERYLIIGNFKSDSTSDTVHLVSGMPPMAGTAYYYIDDVNVHCCTCDSTTSLHAGVGEIKNEDDVSVYPNPATNSLTVTLIKGEGVLAIYNVLGENVFTTKIVNIQTEIDVSEWARGMYFVEVRTEKGVRRKKVVKE